jgi:aldehyde dehydrogenase (NAD+)
VVAKEVTVSIKKPMDDSYGLYIGGRWVAPAGGKTFVVSCPANGERLCVCAEAGAEEVDEAVKAATAALPAWGQIDPPARAAMLNKIADLIEADAERLELVETMDVGRALADSRLMVGGAADQFRYFASTVRTQEEDAMLLDRSTLRITLAEPIGVVGQIVPWNAPIMLAAWKIAPALASGDTVVIKASSAAPLGVLELAKIIDQVLPAGVVNVLTGPGATTGAYLLAHPGFQKLSFTGSTETGCAVATAAADKLIPATLELGGKSANIIFPDCHWEKAVTGVRNAILENSGQVCCAGSRVLVQEDIYERFLGDCVAAFEKMTVGLPWEKGISMGPLVDQGQMEKVLSYIEIGKSEGARVACGGYRVTDDGLDKGFFVRPTILADVDNRMRVAQEEIFGPVACFIRFKDEADAIRLANESQYGLGGGVWTKDLDRAFRVARGVRTGTMWVNTFLEVRSGTPFGGYKQSGYGREVHKAALQHYTQKKTIYLRLEDA